MKVCAIAATCGRHTCIERSLGFFLNQDYKDKFLLIYQNSEVSQALDGSVDTSKVLLVNNHIDPKTGKGFSSLGAIYNDALNYVPEDTDVIIFWDDDDIFLKNHISKGVDGLIRGGTTAYKPAWSYYRYHDEKGAVTVAKVQGTLEPSIFTKASHIREYGFSETTTDQHLHWIMPLGYEGVFTDPNGEPTLIYNWGDSFWTFKTSGNAGDPKNFDNYRKTSLDHGDLVITPNFNLNQYYKI